MKGKVLFILYKDQTKEGSLKLNLFLNIERIQCLLKVNKRFNRQSTIFCIGSFSETEEGQCHERLR